VTIARRVLDCSPSELHWLAGLLEGEGSFLRGPPSAPRTPAVQLTMVDLDVVERAAALLDSAVTVIPPRKAHWRTAYLVRLGGPRAVEWMRRLRPFMGRRRQEQIDRAIATYQPDPTRLLDDDLATEALRRLAEGESVKEVAAGFGATVWCIYDLRLGRTHRHLPRPEVMSRSGDEDR
jgi:hypothetical protein